MKLIASTQIKCNSVFKFSMAMCSSVKSGSANSKLDFRVKFATTETFKWLKEVCNKNGNFF